MYTYETLNTKGSIRENSNPAFVNNWTIYPAEQKTIEIFGKRGRVIQISYLTDYEKITLEVSIDNGKFQMINNSNCLLHICDSRGIGVIQIEKAFIDQKEWYRVNCLIPFDFKENIKIGFENEGDKQGIVSNFHVYYLVEK